MSNGRRSRVKRNRLSQLVGRIFAGRGVSQSNSVSRRDRTNRNNGPDRLKVESLENRQLLAGDMELVSMGPIDVAPGGTPAVIAAATSNLTVETEGEGEPAPNLTAFAELLAADNDQDGQPDIKFYGAEWCPACTAQKELFADGKDNLPFIEVTNPDRSASQFAIDNNINAYPTWEFPDDTTTSGFRRVEGVLTLQQLSSESGIAIPQTETPTFEPIGDLTVLEGSPFHIPIDAYDPDDSSLTVSVSVENPNLLEAVVLNGNRSIRIDMETYGDMVFELFEQRAPEAAGRVIELAEADFYDDIIFHRVIDGFVIQGGDPTGTGTSGSTLPDFDDDFHADLQHNRGGILSFAKSSDDTNNSQFFITEGPTRHLDFNHSIFGQLVEGEDVREAISQHAVNGADKPLTDIRIETIEVFNDTENSVVMLKPTQNGSGSTNVTVTVTDGDGNSHSETFQVDVLADTSNGQPFLNGITTPDRFDPDTPATLQLSSTDVEGDAVTYNAVIAPASQNSGASVTVSQNGLMTVTPASGFRGVVQVNASVRPGPGVTGNSSSDIDNQTYTFNFESDEVAIPSLVDLRTSSDSGSSSSDNITNSGSLSFDVTGVEIGANIQLVNVATGAVLGEQVATTTNVTVTTNNIATLGDGTYNVAARQVINGETGELSTPLSVTYDTTDPASVVGSAATRANVGLLYETDLIGDEEGSSTYALTGGPSSASIDTGSGLIRWTPEASDEGNVTFTVAVTDLAGNTRSEDFDVIVSGDPLAEIRLIARDTDGNIITSLNVGDEFTLELVGVDARAEIDRDGLFAAYVDILFDSGIIAPLTGTASDIEHLGDFTVSPSGTISTGLINELGGASSRISATQDIESLIASVEMRAIGSGSVNLRSEPADVSGNDVLLYGDNNQIQAEEVAYGGLTLTVGLSFTLTDDTLTLDEDAGETVVNVLDNDTTAGSANLSVVSVTQPTEGGFVIVDSGVVLFTPAADFNGTTEFTYRAGDGSGAQDTATVTVTINAVNDPPTGVEDTFNVIANSSANQLDVLANDSIDPDSGETLTVIAANTNTTGATVTVSDDDGAVLYTPAADFSGTDTFTYTVSDGTSTSEVTVTVTVASDDNPPTAVDDLLTVNEDTAEASYDILQNDTRDTDDQSFVIDAVGTPSDGGSVRISSDGSTFFYTPAADFFGTETVSYTIRDTGGGLSVATVTFTVTGINDAPPVTSPTVQLSTGSGATVVLDLDDLPANVDGDSETIALVNIGTPTSGGTATIDADGNLSYTPPDASFTGTDTVTFEVSDGSGTNSTGTVTIVVEDFTERHIVVNFSGGQAKSFFSNVRLRGTDALGNEVDEVASLTETDDLLFDNLLPGDYTVEIPAIPFYSGAEEAQQIPVSSAADDGDMTIDSTMGRLRPEFLSIKDWLGSAPAQSALVVVIPGSAAVLTEVTEAASDSITDASIALNEAGTALEIFGTDPDPDDPADADITAAVLVSDGDVVDQRGQVGDHRLFRVNVAAEAMGYEVASSANTAGTQLAESEDTGSDTGLDTGASDDSLLTESDGEAESVDTTAQDAVSEELVGTDSASTGASTGLTANGTGEGELVANGSSVADVSAPLLSGDLIGGADSDEDEDEPVLEETTADPPQQSGFSRRSFLASSQPSTENATESTESDSSSDSDDLSVEGVDRVLRRGL